MIEGKFSLKTLQKARNLVDDILTSKLKTVGDYTLEDMQKARNTMDRLVMLYLYRTNNGEMNKK